MIKISHLATDISWL